ESRVRRGVDEEDAVLLLDDRLDERIREADVRGGDARSVLPLLGLQLARLVREHEEAAVRLEERKRLLEDELEELLERDVPEELDGDLVQHPQRRVQARELLGAELRVPGLTVG